MGYKIIGYYQDGKYTTSASNINRTIPSFEIRRHGGKPNHLKYKIIELESYWIGKFTNHSQMYFSTLEEALMYVSMQE